MSWNHRVVKRTIESTIKGKKRVDVWFDIREVFYRKNGKPHLYTEDGMTPGGETVEELRQELCMMLSATYKPEFNPSEIRSRAKK